MKPHRIHGELDDVDVDVDDHHSVFSTGYRPPSSSWSHSWEYSSAQESFLSKHKVSYSTSPSSSSNEMRGPTNLSSISIMSPANSFVSSLSSTSSHGWAGHREFAQAWNVRGGATSTSTSSQQRYHMHLATEEEEKGWVLQDKCSNIATEGFGQQESCLLMAKGSLSGTSLSRHGLRSSSTLSKSYPCLFTTPGMLSSSRAFLDSTDVRPMSLSSSVTERHGVMSSLVNNNSFTRESSTKNSLHASTQSSLSIADKGYSLSSMNNSVFSEMQDELLISSASLEKTAAGNSLDSELPSLTVSPEDMNNPFSNRSLAGNDLMNPSMQKTKSSTPSLMKGSWWLRSGSGCQLCCVIIMLLMLLLLLPLVLPPLPPPPLEFLLLPIIILVVLVCQAIASPQLNLVAGNQR